MNMPQLGQEDGVIGVGIDMIEVARIRQSMVRFGERFLQRVFCPEELAYAQNQKFPEIHLAVRFAAKEAASKACGTGIGDRLDWRDMEVIRQERGAPRLRWHGRALKLLSSLGVTDTHVSLTHTRDLGAAVVILTRRMS